MIRLLRHQGITTVLSALLSLWLGFIPLPVSLAADTPLQASTTANQSRAETARIVHALNRLTYGPRPGDIDAVRRMGIDRFIAQQLNPEQIPENQALKDKLAKMEALHTPPLKLLSAYGPPRAANGQKPSQEEKKKRLKESQRILKQAIDARLLSATLSERQLQEVMTEFWFNHFNIYSRKGLDTIWVGHYEANAIRPHALGKFRNLLGSTAHHPAMLFYLDNWQNSAPRNAGATPQKDGRFKGLNENYARELMELHTLGVDNGYSQQDVITLARILTGWGYPRPGAAYQAMTTGNRQIGKRLQARQKMLATVNGSGFYFDASRHDASTKQFLGHTIQGGGVEEGERALDILARHPATAQFISGKLAQYFISDNPSPELVKRLAARFTQTDGDIRAVLDTLFKSPEFWAAADGDGKFKTPYRYAISSIRAGNVPVTYTLPLIGAIQQMGMPIYGCETPNGYQYTREAWLNPDGMTRRISFATGLASGKLPLSANSNPLQASRLMQTLGGNFSQNTRQALNHSPGMLQAALILGSPEFMTY